MCPALTNFDALVGQNSKGVIDLLLTSSGDMAIYFLSPQVAAGLSAVLALAVADFEKQRELELKETQ